MRTATTDEHARRWFRRYWTFGIGSGAHLLVGSLLESARRGRGQRGRVTARGMEGGLVKTRPLRPLEAVRAFGIMLGAPIALAASAAASIAEVAGAVLSLRARRCRRRSLRKKTGSIALLQQSARSPWMREPAPSGETVVARPERGDATHVNKERLAPARKQAQHLTCSSGFALVLTNRRIGGDRDIARLASRGGARRALFDIGSFVGRASADERRRAALSRSRRGHAEISRRSAP